MKHLIYAVVIGIVTVGVSIFILSDSDADFETETKEDPTITIGESFDGTNYTLSPQEWTCDTFEAVTSDDERYGCVLTTELTNTTIFDQILNLDGDLAITSDGVEYESSDELSRDFIADNGLAQEVAVDETVTGGIFFEVPEGTTISTLNIFENATGDPIVITLP